MIVRAICFDAENDWPSRNSEHLLSFKSNAAKT